MAKEKGNINTPEAKKIAQDMQPKKGLETSRYNNKEYAHMSDGMVP